MGEFGWIVMFAYTSTWPSWPRYTWIVAPEKTTLVSGILITYATYISSNELMSTDKHFGEQFWKRAGKKQNKTHLFSYLLQLTARMQIKSHLCRITAGVAMNEIMAQSNLIWSTGRHLWPKWFPALQTLVLPHVKEISRGFHVSFHEVLT